jgi:hypothetical protein
MRLKVARFRLARLKKQIDGWRLIPALTQDERRTVLHNESLLRFPDPKPPARSSIEPWQHNLQSRVRDVMDRWRDHQQK